ncbi:MAG: M23 family metallopeptidase [Parcubacteria group bacterium]|nr:M23 family metallopeptidase [Parcubacteria group bacterium]
MSGLLKELLEILLGFLRFDFRVTWAVASGAARRLFVSIGIELIAIVAFAALAQFNPYWYLACAGATLAISVYQYAFLAAITIPMAANFALEHQLSLVLVQILGAAQVPLAKIATAVAEFRGKIGQIIAQPEGEIGDSIMTLLLQVVRPLELPNAIVNLAADPMIAVIRAVDKSIQELPGKTWQQIKKVAGPVLSGFLVFQWFSVAGWALLAASPPAIVWAPIFAAAVGAILTLLAIPSRKEQHPRTRFENAMLWVLGVSLVYAAYMYYDESLFVLPLLVVPIMAALLFALACWGLRFGGSMLVLVVGVWGIVSPQHWLATRNSFGGLNQSAPEYAEVRNPCQAYQPGRGRTYVRDPTIKPLKEGDVLRLARSSSFESPTSDSKDNLWLEMVGVVDVATGMVDPGAKNFWVPLGYVKQTGWDPAEVAVGATGGAQGALPYNPYAIWDQTAEPPVKVASFNPGLDAPAEVRPNTTPLMHPLGDYRITPIVYYGTIRQRDGMRNWSDVFPASVGTPVRAGAAGTVIAVHPAKRHEVSAIVLRHDNSERGTFYTRYLEVGTILVAVGNTVSQGDTIARSDGRPGASGTMSDAQEPHIGFEVWAVVEGPNTWFPVDTMRWINGVAAQKVVIAPQEFTAYPLYPIPGTEDEYEVPVNRPVSILADRVRLGNLVDIRVLSPEAGYVINGREEHRAYFREPIALLGKPYPKVKGTDAFVWQTYSFYTDHEQAKYGQLIAGINGFETAYGLHYGATRFTAEEDGAVCIGINEAVGIRANNERLVDASADNYVRDSTRDVVRVKVAIRRGGSAI